MGQAISEDTATTLVKSFYDSIANTSHFATAVTRVRTELFSDKRRRAFYNAEIELEDWLLPIAYDDMNSEIQLRLKDVSTEVASVSDLSSKLEASKLEATPVSTALRG
jgi:hypothetical protein